MRPEIVTASADGTHISSPRAFSEVHDNSSIDISAMAQQVATGIRAAAGASEGEAGGMVRTIWNGMMDDLFGSKKAAA
jgi:hypothetical protein